MQRKNYKAYFTVEAAVLYPIVLGVIVGVAQFVAEAAVDGCRKKRN